MSTGCPSGRSSTSQTAAVNGCGSDRWPTLRVHVSGRAGENPVFLTRICRDTGGMRRVTISSADLNPAHVVVGGTPATIGARIESGACHTSMSVDPLSGR